MDDIMWGSKQGYQHVESGDMSSEVLPVAPARDALTNPSTAHFCGSYINYPACFCGFHWYIASAQNLQAYMLHWRTFGHHVYHMLWAWTTHHVLSVRQTLVPAVGRRWQQAACVWSYHSQRWPWLLSHWANDVWCWQRLDTLLGCWPT